MTMREKIARALYKRTRNRIHENRSVRTWEDQSQEIRDDYLGEADTALDAVMDPTEGMRCAGLDVIGGHDMPPAAELKTFQAMIQAAKDGK